MSKQPFMTNRAGVWYYVRRVPDQLATVDPRRIVRMSTGIKVHDDPKGRRAAAAVRGLDAETERFWRETVAGRANAAKAIYDAARRSARKLGFDYAPADELALRPLDEIVHRLEALAASSADDTDIVRGVLGGAVKPQVRLSTLFEAYQASQAASLGDMSPMQIKKWEAPKRRAIANLIKVIGDKDLSEIRRGDALDFREHWQQRVITEGMDIDTANKDFGHIARMLRIVEQTQRLGLQPVFSQMRIEGAQAGQRTAFEPDFVRTRILTSLGGLNGQARAVIMLIAETGLRLSEATGLSEATIHLSGPVPFVQVRPEDRRLKTPQSSRDIPLVGVALEAMREHPKGFDRYRDKAASFSGLVNKYLFNHGLRPTDNHSVYSLRHTFEDRLTAVECPEKIVATLMGHKWQRPRYGQGPSIAHLHRWLSTISFASPSLAQPLE